MKSLILLAVPLAIAAYASRPSLEAVPVSVPVVSELSALSPPPIDDAPLVIACGTEGKHHWVGHERFLVGSYASFGEVLTACESEDLLQEAFLDAVWSVLSSDECEECNRPDHCQALPTWSSDGAYVCDWEYDLEVYHVYLKMSDNMEFWLRCTRC